MRLFEQEHYPSGVPRGQGIDESAPGALFVSGGDSLEFSARLPTRIEHSRPSQKTGERLGPPDVLSEITPPAHENAGVRDDVVYEPGKFKLKHEELD